ncbi:Hypothetical predicted protein [Octopus vulgaris]|uniref:Uncharacterized protein n=1 Tax=Octopus vulgaris TaxID=6645 RepID=A0AA36F2K3_OCTVU|nr:Hypothetical predicted protein [Octopus vulgaris]
MEEVSKLAAMDGFSFNAIAKSDFIQRNLHSQSGKYDKLQPTFANGVRNMENDLESEEKRKKDKRDVVANVVVVALLAPNQFSLNTRNI